VQARVLVGGALTNFCS